MVIASTCMLAYTGGSLMNTGITIGYTAPIVVWGFQIIIAMMAAYWAADKINFK